MKDILSAIISLLLAAYSMRLLVPAIRFFFRKNFRRTENENHFISIVVAARNEETNIGKLISSIMQLEYPSDKFEIIIVDDHSDDETVQRVEDMISDEMNFKILRAGANENGKKAALTKGISEAKGEIIATTDADCSLPTQWLQEISSAFSNEELQLFVGPVIYARKNFLSYFFQNEQLAIQVFAGGSPMNDPMFASGANLAYRRKIFFKTGGYANDKYVSGDDMMLLYRVKKKYPAGCRFLHSRASIVHTLAPANWKEAIQQRSRWLSKMKGMKNTALRFTALVVFFSNLIVPAFLFIAVYQSHALFPLGIAALYKMTVDVLLLSLSVPFFGERIVFLTFIPAEIIYPFVSIIAIAMSVRKKMKWKKRVWNN
ncbi:MAG: glycosyltransferase [Bacteroidetes bacterium]|nr:glycosyltransferase [Bacteroidota bacterium]